MSHVKYSSVNGVDHIKFEQQTIAQLPSVLQEEFVCNFNPVFDWILGTFRANLF